MDTAKRCTRCSEVKTLDNYYTVRRGSKSGTPGKVSYFSHCKSCERDEKQRPSAIATKARSRARHRDRVIDYNRQYRADNPEKARGWNKALWNKRREYGFIYGSADYAALKQECLGRCRAAGCWLDEYTGEILTKPTLDHIVPLSRGGAPYDPDNIAVTSLENNRSKHNLPLIVWMSRNPQLFIDGIVLS